MTAQLTADLTLDGYRLIRFLGRVVSAKSGSADRRRWEITGCSSGFRPPTRTGWKRNTSHCFITGKPPPGCARLTDGHADIGDCSAADLETARMQMLEAKQKSLQGMEDGKEPTRQGPAYERLGEGSLHTHPDHPGCLYILRLRALGDLVEPKPAKGSVPRAKQLLARKLLLPSRRYIHAVKLELGKFERVMLV